MKRFILRLIRWYQRYLSPDTGWIAKIGRILRLRSGLATCIYSPTCSEYTYQAIDAYGIIRGSFLGLKRIVRCHPFAKGGFDPIPKI